MNVRRKLTVAAVLLVLVAAPASCLPTVARAAAQPSLTLTAAPASLVSGASTKLTAAVGVPGATLTLSRKRAGEADFTVVATVVAGPSGAASWTRKPTRSVTFRVDFAGDETWAAVAAETLVGVRPRIKLDVRARKPLLETRRVRCTVTVRPAHPGGIVQLRRRTADGWTTLKDLTLDEESRAAVSVAAGEPGRLVLRADMAADADHLAGRSPSWRTTVFDRRNPYGVPAKHPHLILVDLSKYKLYYHEHGRVVRVFDCVLGRPGLPTPKGRYKIYAKDPRMGGAYGPSRMRYLGLYAIHGTNEPWLLSRFPRNYSHGCTRLSNTNITWLYSRVHVGTPVWNVP
ncbi:MAG: L,D-transpeptidase [Thermoleophilia bacterium]|nr:L,D-transpeptidase [Thermoleophilia bacterium]